jgi:hypothetical protein
MSTYPEYSLNTAIVEFFTQPSATREACDIKAKDLAGGQSRPALLAKTDR